MFDDESQLLFEMEYSVIHNLLIQLGRYPTREEVLEGIATSVQDHSEPNVVFLN